MAFVFLICHVIAPSVRISSKIYYLGLLSNIFLKEMGGMGRKVVVNFMPLKDPHCMIFLWAEQELLLYALVLQQNNKTGRWQQKKELIQMAPENRECCHVGRDGFQNISWCNVQRWETASLTCYSAWWVWPLISSYSP